MFLLNRLQITEESSNNAVPFDGQIVKDIHLILTIGSERKLFQPATQMHGMGEGEGSKGDLPQK